MQNARACAKIRSEYVVPLPSFLETFSPLIVAHFPFIFTKNKNKSGWFGESRESCWSVEERGERNRIPNNNNSTGTVDIARSFTN